MTPIVHLSNLTKRYQGFVLDRITLDVPPGCITGVFGPSGAGKTTLMRLIAGQLRPDVGDGILVFGLDYRGHEREIKNRIGHVSEEQIFYPDQSVAWTEAFLASCYDRWDSRGFREMLVEFGIDRSKKVKHLSRGRKTLLGIAVAMSHGAELLLFDEPTAGLDMVIRRRVLGRLRDFVSEDGRGVIISSHTTDALGDVADYVAILNEGRLVLHDEKDGLLSRWKWVHFREGALAPSVVRRLSRVDSRQLGVSGLSSDFESIRGALEDGIRRGDIKISNASLDDVLIALVEGD